jgi:hypothetical protein
VKVVSAFRAGHTFDENLECSYCDVTWRQFQSQHSRCELGSKKRKAACEIAQGIADRREGRRRRGADRPIPAIVAELAFTERVSLTQLWSDGERMIDNRVAEVRRRAAQACRDAGHTIADISRYFRRSTAQVGRWVE